MDAEQREHERAMDEAAGRIRPLGEVLAAVARFIRCYVVLTEAQLVAVTLWVAHTWVIEATSTTPYFHVTSAEAESGKSRLLEVIHLLVRRAFATANTSVSVLFHVIEQTMPTVLIDEADNLLGDKDAKKDMTGILNAGYRRGMKAHRMGGPQRDRIEAFDVFCPKAIAGLDNLMPTTASRCIRIEMKRRRSDEAVEDFYYDEVTELATPLAGELEAWAAEAVDRLRQARPSRIGLRDRLEEGLRLLLAIAAEAGEDWDRRARAAFKELAGASTAGAETDRSRLLHDIREVFHEDDELATVELLRRLIRLDESPWPARWSDPRSEDGGANRAAMMELAKLLKPFGIHSRKLGPEDHRVRGFRRADCEDAFARYLPPEVGQVGQSPRSSQEAAPQGRTGDGSLSDLTESAIGLVEPDAQPVRPHEGVADWRRFVAERPAEDNIDERAPASLGARCGVPGHVAMWTARDGQRRCFNCEPPAFPGEIVATNWTPS
jgi:hypothetical protein